MANSFSILITADNVEQNAVDLIQQQATELSRQQIKQAIDKGALWLTQTSVKKQHPRRIRRFKNILKVGDELHFYYDPQVLAQTSAPAELISQEQGYSIWYKPTGMLCQGSKWSDHCTITRFVEKQTHSNAYLVHRLDRATRGLIIIGESKKATQALAHMFQQRQLTKHYQAIVKGRLEAAQTVSLALDNKPAISHISPLQYDLASDTSLVNIEIETGRKHQIRRHLAGLGFPIIGDRLYAQDASQDLQLCAYRLEFTCPISAKPKSFMLAPAKCLTLA